MPERRTPLHRLRSGLLRGPISSLPMDKCSAPRDGRAGKTGTPRLQRVRHRQGPATAHLRLAQIAGSAELARRRYASPRSTLPTFAFIVPPERSPPILLGCRTYAILAGRGPCNRHYRTEICEPSPPRTRTEGLRWAVAIQFRQEPARLSSPREADRLPGSCNRRR
jgi:hypothetical protein